MPGTATYEPPIPPGESGSVEVGGGSVAVPAPPVAKFSFKARKMGA